jgi:hypothetical protein
MPSPTTEEFAEFKKKTIAAIDAIAKEMQAHYDMLNSTIPDEGEVIDPGVVRDCTEIFLKSIVARGAAVDALKS